MGVKGNHLQEILIGICDISKLIKGLWVILLKMAPTIINFDLPNDQKNDTTPIDASPLVATLKTIACNYRIQF